MHQGLNKGEYNHNSLTTQRMVVLSPGRNKTLRHPPRKQLTDYNDDQQIHDLRSQLCQAQDQEPP